MPTDTALGATENGGHPDDELPSFPLRISGEPSDPLEPSGASLVRDTPPARPARQPAGPAIREQLGERVRSLQRGVGPLVRRAAHEVRSKLVPTVRRGGVYLIQNRRDPRIIAGAGTTVLLLAFILGTSLSGSGRAKMSFLRARRCGPVHRRSSFRLRAMQ